MNGFSTDALAAGYLGGLIDGEGHVRCHGSGGGVQRSVAISNTDRDILAAGLAAFAQLGIKARIYRKSHATERRLEAFELVVLGRAHLERLAAVVPIRSSRKAEALARALASYRQTQRSLDQIPAAEVRRLYHAEGLSQREIAVHFGVCEETVSRWMRLTAIRSRSHRQRANRQIVKGR